jgi:hypothetical protein
VSKINIRSSKDEKRERCEEENATKKNNKSAKKKPKLAQLDFKLIFFCFWYF